ncbi:nuclear transport factor 2 family protein [Gordonia humi]|uniref:SnoaL-like domain-containing protein n=1 Tax=Gordonia humi TaxID=686429 RepID=A0A840ERL2_9ACTN|nr:nuclear transport factor 2 family protein [Gordonia humi]MBB4134181.1 hypothetical protein [Gordonia humi]
MAVSGTRTDVTPGDLAEIHQLYGRQSHLIDGGRALAWAQTFTVDGEFVSPSYSAPVVGEKALVEFAQAFAKNAAAAGEAHRHVLTNLAVDRVADDELVVGGYLQIVATRHGGESRLLRMTTITDHVVRVGGAWRIARRVVRRDDQPAS